MTTLAEERMSAIHLLRAGMAVNEVAKSLGHSEQWVRKWKRRFGKGGWPGLQEQSRAPKRTPRRLSAEIEQRIILGRSELEAEAATAGGLKFVGAMAVRSRLKRQECQPLPSRTSIERVLRRAGMTKPRAPELGSEVSYPHLAPTTAHQLCQVDIVPHHLTGGTRIACFNAIDVVSRYATGMAYTDRRAAEACDFALRVWQTIGIPHYTQFDNESCFDGGHTHPYVLGQLVRLALTVGTEALFSPARHPESNGYVERFHQEYNRHVWNDLYLPDLTAINQYAANFFQHYCSSGHHSALDGRTPQDLHATPPYHLPPDFHPPKGHCPLYAGRVHFIRRVLPDGSISVLNVNWNVPDPQPLKGVWATLELQPAGATLSIYDAAPDALTRRTLAIYPFPVQEPILPRTSVSLGRPTLSEKLAPPAFTPNSSSQQFRPVVFWSSLAISVLRSHLSAAIHWHH